MVFLRYFALLLSSFIGTLIEIELFLLLVRAVLSWVMPDRSSKISQIVYSLTEPVIYPIRRFLSRFSFVRTCPIDLSFLAAVLLLEVILSMLP